MVDGARVFSFRLSSYDVGGGAAPACVCGRFWHLDTVVFLVGGYTGWREWGLWGIWKKVLGGGLTVRCLFVRLAYRFAACGTGCLLACRRGQIGPLSEGESCQLIEKRRAKRL